MEGKKKEIGFHYAFNGLREVFKSEKNFRVHILATLLVVGFGFYFDISAMEWLAIVIVIGLVLSAEILNTAIEEVINYLKPDIHPTAKKIKDIAAAGVFAAAMSAVVVGLIIFIPKII